MPTEGQPAEVLMDCLKQTAELVTLGVLTRDEENKIRRLLYLSSDDDTLPASVQDNRRSGIVSALLQLRQQFYRGTPIIISTSSLQVEDGLNSSTRAGAALPTTYASSNSCHNENAQEPVTASSSVTIFSIEMWDRLFFGLILGLRNVVAECVWKRLDEQWRLEDQHDTNEIRSREGFVGGTSIRSVPTAGSLSSGASEEFCRQPRNASNPLPLPQFAVALLHPQKSTTFATHSPSVSARQRETKLAWQLAWKHAKDLDEESWTTAERRLSKEWISATRLGGYMGHSPDEPQLYGDANKATTNTSAARELVKTLWNRCCLEIRTLSFGQDHQRGSPSSSSALMSDLLLQLLSGEVVRLAAQAGFVAVSSVDNCWMDATDSALTSPSKYQFGRFCELVLHRKRHHFPPPLVAELRGIFSR
jgi:hypothetical protein